MKNKQGQRIHDPKKGKQNIADFYENLYRKKAVGYDPYHHQIKQEMKLYYEDRDNEENEYNQCPTQEETLQIITNKKNGKSTTDLKNEMLKNTKESMIEVLMPMIKAVWEEEAIPKKTGTMESITSLWRGKGDKEEMNNHRRITASSSIGNIIEEAINNRIDNTVLDILYPSSRTWA